MVEIGGKPILWHILMHYAHYGHEVFVIGLGDRGEVIKSTCWITGHSTGT
jgi:glucose-1-phosphate cytidylyltransferase